MSLLNNFLLITSILITILLLFMGDTLGILLMIVFLVIFILVVKNYEISNLYKLLYLIVTVLNGIAFIFDFYHIVWFDDVAHVLNAFAVTLFIAPVFYETVDFSNHGFVRPMVILFSFGMLVGVVWEVWEFFADIYVFEDLGPDYTDTITDLIYDGIGAIAASLLILKYEGKEILGYQLLIWSEDPDELQKFYKDVLELERIAKLTLPDDYGYGFKVGKHHKLWIGKHSEVEGKNKDPNRFIIQLYVEDVHAWYEKTKDKVKVIAEPFETPPTRGEDDPRYCYTFADPEGNLLQFMTDK